MLERGSFFPIGPVDGKFREVRPVPGVFEISAKVKLFGGGLSIGVVEFPIVFSNFLLVNPIEKASHELPFKNVFNLIGLLFIFCRSIKLIESEDFAYRWLDISVIFDMVGLYLHHLVSGRNICVNLIGLRL
jgi:hypothetical protein